MVSLGLKPGVAGWKAEMNPQSLVGTPTSDFSSFKKWANSGLFLFSFVSHDKLTKMIKA